MTDREEIKEKTQDIASHATDYFDTWYRLTVLKITEKTVTAASGITGILVVGLFGLFVLFFAGLGAAWWIGNAIHNHGAGFMIIAGFWFLVAIVFLLLRRRIIFPIIRNKIISKIYE